MAMMVSTRLWLGGVGSEHRDRKLADQLLRMVKACCLPLCALLVVTDGWAASAGSLRRAFRDKVKRAGKRGRCHLQAWPEIVSGTVIKKTAKKQVVEVIRCMAQGTIERAEELFAFSAGGIKLNTAFIERFNGTMRERLASLTRRSRHPARRIAALGAGMWLVGCPSNWCWPHHERSRRLAHASGRRGEIVMTPAMAAGLTDHRLSRPRGAHVSDRAAAIRGPEAARSTEEHRTEDFSSVFESTTPITSLAQGGLLCLHQIRVSYRQLSH